MKFTSMTIITALLLQILSPGLSYASGQPRAETAHRADRPEFAQDRATIVAERAIKLLYALDVRVMSRGGLDISKLRTGLIAQVVHTSEGTRISTIGKIVQIAEDGIALWTSERPAERNKIAYEDIDTLVVASDGRALERWQRRAEGRFLVMSRGKLNLDKLDPGWYAYVVYRHNAGQRAEVARILERDERRIVIRSEFAGGRLPRSNRVIARDDIFIIVAAQVRGDIVGWRHARQVIQCLTKESRVRFKAPSVMGYGEKPKWTVGRLVEVNQDTFVIGVGRSIRDVHRVPADALTDLEFTAERRRHTGKGLLIGLVLGLIIGSTLYEAPHDPGYYDPDMSFAQAVVALRVFSLAIGCGTFGALIGYGTKTDRWIDVPVDGLNLSIAPTQNKGFQAALSFHF